MAVCGASPLTCTSETGTLRSNAAPSCSSACCALTAASAEVSGCNIWAMYEGSASTDTCRTMHKGSTRGGAMQKGSTSTDTYRTMHKGSARGGAMKAHTPSLSPAQQPSLLALRAQMPRSWPPTLPQPSATFPKPIKRPKHMRVPQPFTTLAAS